jgi:hypothetical protein
MLSSSLDLLREVIVRGTFLLRSQGDFIKVAQHGAVVDGCAEAMHDGGVVHALTRIRKG